MDLPLIPPELEKWDISILDNLIKIRDIERETFEFKGVDFKQLYTHLCAFANYPISGFIVLGVKEDKPEFKKVGFDFDKEDWVRNEINNQMANVEPIPKIGVKPLHDEDNGRLFPVLKIEGEVNRPYFVKGSGQCYVRIGASTHPASRTTVLYLLSNIIAKRTDVERLRSAAGFLKEALTYTCENIKDIKPTDIDAKILPIDLTYLRNAALSTEWFLAQNDLLGGHIGINSYSGGLHSFLHNIERINLLIDTYNIHQLVEGKQKIKYNMQFWEPGHNKYNQAVGFLDKVIIKCNSFLSKFQ
jgi:hypothetical protein